MPVIILHQKINAPRNICFDLARDVATHTETTSQTDEKAVAGRTEGLLELGERVTWEAVHLGVRQRLTAELSKMEKDRFFEDIMVRGAFHSFTHEHHFKTTRDGGTMMTDVFDYRSPFGLIGRVADRIFLEFYMKKLLKKRGLLLKQKAEALYI
ncbi:SRPBCC family protein [Halobacillus litoralis]|uniref:SRPBCC family protein n=1 Tax=Halobacillus litoralis TaxID=45668 RepID=UPI001CD2EE0D|nr:SRPBCC family protein [Halobacillus litoralis]MCA0970197.1 SRPBCC family protein [Halobacillus litoralis]